MVVIHAIVVMISFARSNDKKSTKMDGKSNGNRLAVLPSGAASVSQGCPSGRTVLSMRCGLLQKTVKDARFLWDRQKQSDS